MHPARVGILIVLGLLLAACLSAVRTLHPLFADDELVFDPAILGSWIFVDADDIDSLTFATSSDERLYTVRVSGDYETLDFDVRLGRLGGNLFLDLSAPEPEGYFAVPVHMFCKIGFEPDVMSLNCLDEEWLGRGLLAGDFELPYELLFRSEDDTAMVVTASTAQLQEFIIDHASDPDAFGDPEELRRPPQWERVGDKRFEI